MDEKMGNELPKRGNSLPILDVDFAGLSYEAAVAAAIRQELGGNPHATKLLARRTGTSPSTAKNWLSGSAGPSGAHLIELMRSSDLVFEVVLMLAGRIGNSADDSRKEASKLLRRAIEILEHRV
jgi:hypothetical protein